MVIIKTIRLTNAVKYYIIKPRKKQVPFDKNFTVKGKCKARKGSNHGKSTTLHDRCADRLRGGNGADRMHQLRKIQNPRRISSRRKKRRRMGDRIRLRHVVFLGRRLRRLRGSARLEYRRRRDLDRRRQRDSRLSPVLAAFCKQDEKNDEKAERENHARLL